MCFGYATVVHIATCMHVLVSTVYVWEVCRGYSFYAVTANCKCFSTCFTSGSPVACIKKFAEKIFAVQGTTANAFSLKCLVLYTVL